MQGVGGKECVMKQIAPGSVVCKVHTNYTRVLYVQKQKKVNIWPNIMLLK